MNLKCFLFYIPATSIRERKSFCYKQLLQMLFFHVHSVHSSIQCTFHLRHICTGKSQMTKEKPVKGSANIRNYHLFCCWVNVVI